MNLVEACQLVSGMDKFATMEKPLLHDFASTVLRLIVAEVVGEHLMCTPCWCDPRVEVVHAVR